MTKLTSMLLACLIAVTFVAAPIAASARMKDRPGVIFCKSGKRTLDSKNCKENGGNL